MEAQVLAALLPDFIDDVYRYIRSMSRDSVTAEDLTQETLTRALERSESLSDSSRLRSWLFRIAHNLTIDHYRSRRESPTDINHHEVELLWQDDTYTVDAQEYAARLDDIERIRDALVRIPTQYRSVVVLHDAHGWTSREIAELLSISLSAAKQRLRRGRMMLVTAIAQESQRREATAGISRHCWNARRHVSAFLDGDLSQEQSESVTAHLSFCPTCPPLYASLVATRKTLPRMQDSDQVIPDALRQRLQSLSNERS